MQELLEPDQVAAAVRRTLAELPVCDIHTHLFDHGMGNLLLSGIDELLTYHYHVAELFRVRPDLDYEAFFALPAPARADLVWRELFVARAPVSEVGLGVVMLLSALGLDPRARDLRAARAWFAARPLEQRVDQAFTLAGLRSVVMTNDPLEARERAAWERGFARDPRFLAALRLDSALIGWPQAVPALRALGFAVAEALDAATADAMRRYLTAWAGRMEARYLAISLPPSFRYPDDLDPTSWLLARAAIPAARELGIPLALMIGVRRQVNPRLRLAGDSVGQAGVQSLERFASDFHDVKILATYLAREDQHALCVAARKLRNLVPFGCWWFVNNPTLIREITAMRLDLLGPTFVPQHSDARVLEQLVFKWRRSRALLGEVLAERWAELAACGCPRTEAEIAADLGRMLDGSLIR